MNLKDHLAASRTRLANQRTFLAYSRTALMTLVTGITLMKLFSQDHILPDIGIIFIPTSLIIFLAGVFSYFKTYKNIKKFF
jgi:putative membrane protein